MPVDALERLYTTAEAGAYLSLHADDVCRLIRRERLRARMLVVRGKGRQPRYMIPESALREFVESLPMAGGISAAVREPSHAKRHRRPRGLTEELASVRQYM